MINQPKYLPVIYHRRADKTGFYNPNFGVVSLFSSLKHEDHVVVKRRIASAVSFSTSIASSWRQTQAFILTATQYSLASIRPYEPRVGACIQELLTVLKNVGEEQDVILEIWLQYVSQGKPATMIWHTKILN